MATIDASLHRPRATSGPKAAASAGEHEPRCARLVRRRFALNIRTPRELLVPLLTPVLFAPHHRPRRSPIRSRLCVASTT